MDKYGTAGQATEDNITRPMPLACRINKATDAHSEYEILTVFHDKNYFAKALQY
jgi:hypothetical protein